MVARIEVANDFVTSVMAAIRAEKAYIWTAMPGIIDSYDATTMTAVVQPAIKGRVLQPNGTIQDVQIDLLHDVPVHFPSGGGFTLSFPLQQGDEVLVVFAKSCIDAWWQSGGVQPQLESRMHDLSDGFCIPKVWSQPKKLSGLSTNTAQFRSDDGSTYVEIASGGVVNVVAANGCKITGPLVVDGGTTVKRITAGSVSYAGATIPSQTFSSATITATGCRPGDTVSLGFSVAPFPFLTYIGYVSSNDTVTVLIANPLPSGSLIAPASTISAVCIGVT